MPIQNRGRDFWAMQIPGWLLLIYLIYAQGITAFGYDLGVAMGTQEPVETVTEVGVAFWYGFAFADLVVYLPLLAAGLAANGYRRNWGVIIFGAALGITVYWPVVCLSAIVTARGSTGWSLPDESDYWLILPLVSLWGLWGLWQISRQRI